MNVQIGLAARVHVTVAKALCRIKRIFYSKLSIFD